MNTRFELRLSEERREALAVLARQSGISSADLARLAINRLLEDRDVKLPAPVEAA